MLQSLWRRFSLFSSDRTLNLSVMLSKLPSKEGILEDMRLCRPLHKLPSSEVDRLKWAKKMPYNVMPITDRDYFVRMDIDQLESYKKLLPIEWEQKQIEKHKDKPIAALGDIEGFLVKLSQIQRPLERIRIMHFQLEMWNCTETNYEDEIIDYMSPSDDEKDNAAS